MSPWRLGDLAHELEAGLQGDPAHEVMAICEPGQGSAAQIAVVSDSRWLQQMPLTSSEVLVLPAELAERVERVPHQRQILIVSHPRQALARLLALFYPEPSWRHQISPQASLAASVHCGEPVEIGPFAVLAEAVQLGAGTRIGPHAVIGAGARLGRDCRIGAHVVIGERVQIGDRVIIHPGTVIGSDGYGFYQAAGQHHKIPQVGSVQIGDDVEIGAHVTIDRGTLGDTVIGAGSKIDNLVQIGHNVKVGKHCLLVAQVGISGSSELGDGVTLAGQVGVAGHLKIGSGVTAAGKSGITQHIPPNTMVSGFPAQPHRRELQERAALRHLPAYFKSLRQQRARQSFELESTADEPVG